MQRPFAQLPRAVAIVLFVSGCALTLQRFQDDQGPVTPPIEQSDQPLALGVTMAPDEALGVPVSLESAAGSKNDAPPVDAPESERCPEGMVLVEGESCPNARQTCTNWLENPEVYSYARCAEFAPDPVCSAPREHKRFCIDVREYTPPHESLPKTGISFTEAGKVCASQGKRLCLESEWQFACEGEAMLPYPYGFVRDSTACNFERTDLYQPNGDLRDLREPSGSRPRCVSPFGVRDMVGNVDEWAIREEKGAAHRSVLRGGWWMPGRNRCRASTTAHDEVYKGPQSGFRCCSWPR
jgi:hypothetical protein